MNNVSLVGRLTADVEGKTTANGKSVANFCIAVNKRFQQNGEQTANFINCVAWGSTADFIGKYFSKGDSIALTGEIQTRSYEDSNGTKRYVFEVLVDKAEFCGGKRKASDETSSDKELVPLDCDEELPF